MIYQCTSPHKPAIAAYTEIDTVKHQSIPLTIPSQFSYWKGNYKQKVNCIAALHYHELKIDFSKSASNDSTEDELKRIYDEFA